MKLEARLERLERENRWMKKFGIAAFLVASIVIFSGQTKTNKVVEANEFRLVDSSGKARGSFLTNADGQTLLSLSDSSGKISTSLGIGTQGSTLMLGSADAGTSVLLSAGPSRFSGLRMLGATGEIHLAVDSDTSGPSVRVEDKEGYSSVLGRSDLVVTATGKKEQTPAASLVLFGKDQKVIRSMP